MWIDTDVDEIGGYWEKATSFFAVEVSAEGL